MRTETKLARVQNVPEKPEENRAVRIQMFDSKVNSNQFDQKLTQWRLLFNYQRIFDMRVSEFMLRCDKGAYLQMKLYDFVT